MAPAQHMEMKVKHALAAMHTGIDDDTVPGIGNPFLFRDLVTGQHQTPELARHPNLEVRQSRPHVFGE